MDTFIYLVTFMDEDGYFVDKDTVDVEASEESEAWHKADSAAQKMADDYGYYQFDFNLVDAC